MKRGTGWDDPPGVKMPFQLKKLEIGAGSSHPATARLFLQPMQLLQTTTIAHDRQDLIGRYIFRCFQEFIRVEQRRDAFLGKCEEFARGVREGTAIVAQPHALELKEPEGIEEDYQLFLLRLAIALRMAVSGAALILFSQPLKWPQFSKRVRGELPVGHPLRVTIDTHERWTSDLFEVRGELEHDPYLFRGFTVQQDGVALKVVEPQLPDGTSAVQAFPRFYADGFTFAEELVISAITTKLPKFAKLREIPENQRDRSMPVRFVLEIAEGG